MKSDDCDITNQQLERELRSWHWRNWFTPQNTVLVLGFLIGGALWGQELSNRVAAAEKDLDTHMPAIEAEKAARSAQIQDSERRINSKIDDLKDSVKEQFIQTNTQVEGVARDVRKMNDLLIQILRDENNHRRNAQ